eukprot:Skav227356  [mRNA]  locus=scaffold1121:17021:28878:+ [translate_table: standard]
MDSSRARNFILIEAIRLALVGLRGIVSALERAFVQYESVPAGSAASGASTPPGAPSVDWDVVSAAPADPPPTEVGSGLASPSSLTVPPCPLSCLDLCNLLGPSESIAISRAERAWEAGWWAKAVAEGKIRCVPPSPALPGTLRNSVYVILRAPGLERPVHVRSSAEYFKLIPNSRKGGSLSHAFPSIAEAKVYCFAYGIAFPALHKSLESVLVNDLLVSCPWKKESAWKWRSPSHINILETVTVGRLFKDSIKKRPGTRLSVAVDSHVALASIAKGRSPSCALRPALRRIMVMLICGDLYPALRYAPTRWNPADHPTRFRHIPQPSSHSISDQLDFQCLLDLALLSGLSRPASSWLRLVLLLCLRPLPWWTSDDSWRYSHWKARNFPFTSVLGFGTSCPRADDTHGLLDFDQTLGFPGEGPSSFGLGGPLLCGLICLPGLVSACSPLSACSFPLVVSCTMIIFGDRGTFDPRSSFTCCAAAMYAPLGPRDKADERRAQTRNQLPLSQGRPVLGKTQEHRDKLLENFERWLANLGVSMTEFLAPQGLDVEVVNTILEKYGRELYAAGRPYGHYSELINAVAGKRPRLRRSLQGAWDVAYAWLREEPPVHRQAMPWQILLSLISAAFSWGWYEVAGVLALSWGAICRIGEVLEACRKHLLMPRDFGYTLDYMLLQIQEPKTRFRAARHQVARLDHPQLMKVVELAFFDVPKQMRIWPWSPQTLRYRFKKLLASHGLDQASMATKRTLDLGSLRAGGATWMLTVSEDSEMVRRRGRWLTAKIMEVYVQEVSSLQFVHMLPSNVKEVVLLGVQSFPMMLAALERWWSVGLPKKAWKELLVAQAASKGVGEWLGSGIGCEDSPVHIETPEVACDLRSPLASSFWFRLCDCPALLGFVAFSKRLKMTKATRSFSEGSHTFKLHYHLTCESLGRGTFGQVRKAISRATGEEFAVKVIPLGSTEGSMDAKILAEARQEEHVMQRVGRHEHCVALLETFSDFMSQRFYFVMEKCESNLMDSVDYVQTFGRLAPRALVMPKQSVFLHQYELKEKKNEQ